PLSRRVGTHAGPDRVPSPALRTRGPRTATKIAERYGLTASDVDPALERLVARGVVRRGDFMPEELEGGSTPVISQYIHIAVLDEVQRRQVHARRVPRPVATAEQFAAFLLRRHPLPPEHRPVRPPRPRARL